MPHAPKSELVLSVYLISAGFAFTFFEGPFAPYEWGIRSVTKTGKRGDAIAQIKCLIEEYRPLVLVIEDAESKNSKRSSRVRRLYRRLTRLADIELVEVVAYPKEIIHKSFASVCVKPTKANIASAIARQIPIFINKLPPKRRLWDSMPRRQSLFDAAALAMTHYIVRSSA